MQESVVDEVVAGSVERAEAWWAAAQVLAVSWGLKVIGAVVILIVGMMLANWVSRLVHRRLASISHLDPTVRPLLARVVRSILIVLVLVIALNNLGVETTSLIALLGAAGLAIGLALQGALGNIASGFMLVLFRPFDVGDVVEVDGSTVVVREISLFSTHAQGLDGVYTVIPNNDVWNHKIRNFARLPVRRIDFKVGISYNDDIDTAFAVLRRIFDEEPRVLAEPAPTIAVFELADSAVNLIAWPWTKSEDWWQTRLDLNKRIKEELEAAGLTIPFPQRDVHLYREAPAPREATSGGEVGGVAAGSGEMGPRRIEG